MKKDSRKKLFLVGVILAIFVILILIAIHKTHPSLTIPQGEGNRTNEILPISEKISAPNGTIYIRVARTQAQQELGLSYFKSLPQNQGMLFPFAKLGIYPFWMIGMNFPLDMVWLKNTGGANSETYSVISVTQDATPQSYPATFQSTGPIDAVLEINANDASKFGLIPGAEMTVSNT